MGTPRRTARSAPHPARSHGRSWRTCPARRCGRTCCSGCRDSTRFPLLFSSRNHCSAHPRQGGQDGKIEPEQRESPAFEEPEAAATEARQDKGKLHDPAREAKRFIQGVQPVRLSSVRIVQRGENYSPEKPAAHYAYVLILPSCLIPEVPLLGYSRENEGLLPRPHRTQSPNATKPLSEARRMPARGIRNPHPRRAQALNNDEARLDSSRASQLPCGRRTVAVRRRCLVAGSLRGAGSARRGRGTRGAGSLRGAGSAGSARGARRARGAGHGRAGRKLGSAFGAHRVRELGFRPAFRTRLVDLDCCWSEAHGRSFLVSNQYCTRGPPPSGTSPHRGGPPRSTGGNARTEAARLSGA